MGLYPTQRDSVSITSKWTVLEVSRDGCTKTFIPFRTECHSNPHSTNMISLRQHAKNIISKCVKCRKVNGQLLGAQNPSQLSKVCLLEAPPFTVTGVDYTWTLLIRGDNGTLEKTYTCLYTCASTRAVHLEAVPNLTEHSFFQGFPSFVKNYIGHLFLYQKRLREYVNPIVYKRLYLRKKSNGPLYFIAHIDTGGAWNKLLWHSQIKH